MTLSTLHPEERLVEWVYGELPAAEADAVRAHVEGCARCSDAVAGYGQVRRVAAELPRPEAPVRGLESLLAYAEQHAARQRPSGNPAPRRTWWVLPGVGLAAVLAAVLWHPARQGAPTEVAVRVGMPAPGPVMVRDPERSRRSAERDAVSPAEEKVAAAPRSVAPGSDQSGAPGVAQSVASDAQKSVASGAGRNVVSGARQSVASDSAANGAGPDREAGRPAAVAGGLAAGQPKTESGSAGAGDAQRVAGNARAERANAPGAGGRQASAAKKSLGSDAVASGAGPPEPQAGRAAAVASGLTAGQAKTEAGPTAAGDVEGSPTAMGSRIRPRAEASGVAAAPSAMPAEAAKPTAPRSATSSSDAFADRAAKAKALAKEDRPSRFDGEARRKQLLATIPGLRGDERRRSLAELCGLDEQLGLRKEAVTSCTRVVTEFPESDEARQATERLKVLTGSP